MQRLLAYARAVVDDATVDREGNRHKITWRINSWANVNRTGHGNFVALGESHRLTPRAGVFIVFPSWLLHGVCPYRGNRERISIAINFSIAG